MSRKLKRAKAIFEKQIMETWFNTNKGKIILNDAQKIIVRAIKNMVLHFRTRDRIDGIGSRHFDIIKTLYLSSQYKLKKPGNTILARIKTFTRIGYAEKFNLDIKTLRTYTDLYIKCFEENLKNIQNGDEWYN